MGWLESTIAEVGSSAEHAIFSEECARRPGWLQGLDPRAKLVMFLATALTASASSSLASLAAIYLVILAAARASQIPVAAMVKRAWLGVPLYAAVVIVPSLFLGPPPTLLSGRVGPLALALSEPALWRAAVFVARVGVCVSLATLLVLTTPWAELMRAARALRVPPALVLVASMAYRYLFLLLHALNGMLEARRSRLVRRPHGSADRRWVVAGIAYLLRRSLLMSGEVYEAMLARGFGGEVRTLLPHRMRARDWAAVGGALLLSAGVLLAARLGAGS